MNLRMCPTAVRSTGQLSDEAEPVSTAEGKVDRKQGQQQFPASVLWGRVDGAA